MRITDAVKVDAEFRDYRKKITVAASIERRIEWHKEHNPTRYTESHARRATEALAEIRSNGELSRQNKISWYRSSRAIHQTPVKELMKLIFYELPEPKKAKHDELTKETIRQLHMQCKEQKAKQYGAQLRYAIAVAAYKRWYMIFNTLTVAPEHYDDVFNPETNAFQNYIRATQRAFDTSIPRAANDRSGSNPKWPTQDYFACVEEGTKNGRLHIHVMHLTPTIPQNARDPNYGKTRPDRQELDCLRELWPYGTTSPIIVRTTPTDAWGLALYRWPIDRKTGEARLVKPAQAIAGYMTKYVTKSFTKERSKNLWRVRKNHSLGMPLLRELLSTCSPQDLLNIATNTTIRTTLNNATVPSTLLRLAALKLYQTKTLQADTSTTKTLPTVCQMAKHCVPMPSPLHSSAASIQSITTSSRQNTTNTRITTTNLEDSFKQTQLTLNKQAQRLRRKYFNDATGGYGTDSVHDKYLR